MTSSLVERRADGSGLGVALVVPAEAPGRTGAVLDDVLLDGTGWEDDEECHVPRSMDTVVLAPLREAAGVRS